MEYSNIVKGKFNSRPNRFIAEVSIDGRIEKAHVKNTGRLKELLVPGCPVYLQDHSGNMGKRKLRYSLIAVQKDERVVNIDSQLPNKAAFEALENGKIMLPGMDVLALIRPETAYGDSRFDFYVEDVSGRKAFIEIKGCTLNDNGTGKFPDAPSTRAVKHVNELIRLNSEGYHAYIIFICTMKGISKFEPNASRHLEFAEVLKSAEEQGVCILCYDCTVTESSVSVDGEIPVNI